MRSKLIFCNVMCCVSKLSNDISCLSHMLHFFSPSLGFSFTSQSLFKAYYCYWLPGMGHWPSFICKCMVSAYYFGMYNLAEETFYYCKILYGFQHRKVVRLILVMNFDPSVSFQSLTTEKYVALQSVALLMAKKGKPI